MPHHRRLFALAFAAAVLTFVTMTHMRWQVEDTVAEVVEKNVIPPSTNATAQITIDYQDKAGMVRKQTFVCTPIGELNGP